jgi:ribosomal protein L24
MSEMVEAGDFVRISSGRHKGKTGIVQRKTEHSNRSTDYFIQVPGEDNVYRVEGHQLEKIDQLPGDPPLIERG